MAFRRPAQGRPAGINYLKPAVSDLVALKATATIHAKPMRIAYEEVLRETKNKAKNKKQTSLKNQKKWR